MCCYLVRITQLCPENVMGKLGPVHLFRFPSNFHYEGILWSSHLRNSLTTHLYSSSWQMNERSVQLLVHLAHWVIF